MPTPQNNSARYFWVSLALLALVVLSLVAYIRAEREIDRANEQRYDSFLLADELRQSSDDLSRMVRSYVATGNPLYKQHYDEILGIRAGRNPRPRDAGGVYWDLVLDDDVRPRPAGEAVALLTLMQRAGFTPAEFAKLAQASAASDALSRTEHAAMALAESSTELAGGARLQAMSMLYDSAYRVAKAGIMRPIEDCRVMVAARTAKAVRFAELSARVLRVAFVTSGVVLVFLLWLLLSSIRAEAAARIERESLFRAVFDNASVGLAQLSVSGRFVNVNREYARITGYSLHELLASQLTALQITHPEDRACSEAHARSVLEGNVAGCALTKRYVRKDGTTIWVDLSTQALRKGNETDGIIAAAVDVSERVRAEQELERHRQQLEQLVVERTRELEDKNVLLQAEINAHQEASRALAESEATFRFIAENAYDVIWMIDANTNRYTYISPSVARQRGLGPEELLGRPPDFGLSAESGERMNSVLAGVRRRWQAGERVHSVSLSDLELLHKHGETIHVDAIMTMHADESGRLESILGVTRDITERKRTEDAIRRLAFYDGLTDLPNRRLLLDRLHQAVARARRERSCVALLFIDLDKFKPINDTLGHQTGDWLLQAVAKRMLECLRPYDTAARIGGDEFIVLLPGLELPRDALAVAERIRAAISVPFVTVQNHKLEISCSIGVTVYPDDADNERELLHAGDEAMYRAKNGGRNKVESLHDARGSESRSPRPADALVLLVWKPSYACGNPDIDVEHRELFRLANCLLQKAAHRDTHSADFKAALASLLTHVTQHFQHEEAILEESGYADLAQHICSHRALLDRVGVLNQRMKTAQVGVGELIEFVAFEVIGKHLLEEDRGFFPLFQRQS